MHRDYQPEHRLVVCERCDGDGGWEVAQTGPYGYRYDPRDGGLLTDWRRCDACDATGEVTVEVHPIDFDDLAAIPDDEADPYSAFAYRGGNP